MKKITVYVDEKELEVFDSKMPTDTSRSHLLRELMKHCTYLKSHSLAEGVIVAKSKEGQDSFLIHLFSAYLTETQEFSAGNIIRIPTSDILKYNLEIGDTVKLCPDDSKPI